MSQIKLLDPARNVQVHGQAPKVQANHKGKINQVMGMSWVCHGT